MPYPGYAGLHRRCGHGGFSCGGVWIVLASWALWFAAGRSSLGPSGPGSLAARLPIQGASSTSLDLASCLLRSAAGWLTGITGRRLFQLPAPPLPSTAAAQHRSGRHLCQVSPIWHPSSGYTRRLFAASFRQPSPRVRRGNNSQRELFFIPHRRAPTHTRPRVRRGSNSLWELLFIPRRRTHAYACARTRSCARRRD